MKQLLIYFRFKQLFAHNAHNFASKATFFSDHEFLGSLYTQAEGFYDNLAERMIGLGIDFDPIEIQAEAVDLLKEVKFDIEDNRAAFQIMLSIEKEILSEIEKLCSTKISQGTLQLLGNFADLEEVNVYKLKRRLKG